jgi:DNA-nicking Smr family endonuclease
MSEHPVIVQLPIEVYEQMKADLRVSKREHLEERIRTYESVIEVLEEGRVKPGVVISLITMVQKHARQELEKLVAEDILEREG